MSATENTTGGELTREAGGRPWYDAEAAGESALVNEVPDSRLAAAMDIAREAAMDEAGEEPVGEHVGVHAENDAVTHLFEAKLPGYRGWRWAVTVAQADTESSVTVSEVVLLPGPDALLGRDWVPWSERVQAGDLGVGDVVLTPQGDPRLAPGYLTSDDTSADQELGEVRGELGLGRRRVLSFEGRTAAAERWMDGEFGPRSDMARGAADHCGTCGFYVRVAGSLRAAFGVCGNELAPADGRVVHAEYGCGAHSETEVDTSASVPVAELVYDDAGLEIEWTQPDPDAQEAPTVELDFAPQPDQ